MELASGLSHCAYRFLCIAVRYETQKCFLAVQIVFAAREPGVESAGKEPEFFAESLP